MIVLQSGEREKPLPGFALSCRHGCPCPQGQFAALSQDFQALGNNSQATRLPTVPVHAARLRLSINRMAHDSPRGNIAVGIGYSDGEKALSVGYGVRFNRASISIGAAFSGSHNSVGTGFGFKL